MKAEPALRNWIPRRFLQRSPEVLHCEWLYLGDKRFEEPFFDETVASCRSHPYNSSYYKVITVMEDMVAGAAELSSIAPSAFIFHTSRCGSTLMTQLLSLFPSNIVVAEPPALDQLLRLPLQAGTAKVAQQFQELWFKTCVDLLGQIRFKNENKFIIKLDCWHLAFFDQIAAWYPDTPKIIVYREPVASINSLLKHPGMQAVPFLLEPELFGLVSAEVEPIDTPLYLNQVFAAMYGQIQKIAVNHPDVLLLDYGDGVGEMFRQISNTLQLQVDSTTSQRIKERLLYHSKNGTEKYQQEKASGPQVSSACQETYADLRLKIDC